MKSRVKFYFQHLLGNNFHAPDGPKLTLSENPFGKIVEL